MLQLAHHPVPPLCGTSSASPMPPPAGLPYRLHAPHCHLLLAQVVVHLLWLKLSNAPRCSLRHRHPPCHKPKFASTDLQEPLHIPALLMGLSTSSPMPQKQAQCTTHSHPSSCSPKHPIDAHKHSELFCRAQTLFPAESKLNPWDITSTLPPLVSTCQSHS